jgi:transcriptional regulator with GAF, ATPase, and Fis domain
MRVGDEDQQPVTSTEVDEHGAAESVSVRVRELHVLFSPQIPEIKKTQLDAASVTLGREVTPLEGLALADSQVSREHARLHYESATDTWWVSDCRSRNGTYLDGRRVSRAPVGPGSILRVGRSLLLFTEHEVQPGESWGDATPSLLGESLLMRRLRGKLKSVAEKSLPVLLLGESGVGKECVAGELHRLSGRKGAFIPVNCAAIPDELAESEFFGHAAGAFSGARQGSEGLFASAEGGTLFLDEVGELPPSLQPKLLRALATGEVRPVGNARVRKVDVRIVAATNRELHDDVAANRFRGDLFARLAGWTLRVPPLRERREDILLLAEAFLKRLDPEKTLSAAAAEALLLYEWPFNVRELEHAMALAAARSAGVKNVRPADLPEEIVRPKPFADPQPECVSTSIPIDVPRHETPNKEQLEAVLMHFRGNVAQVAAFFGKARQQVYRWAQRYGIDLELLRNSPPPPSLPPE